MTFSSTLRSNLFGILKSVVLHTQSFNQHVITVNDISGFVDHSVQQRNLNNKNIVVRIGLDGGGGFFKVWLSVYDLDAQEAPPVKTLSKKYKGTGVKKIFVIGITPDVPKKYSNVKVWNSIGLSSFNRSFNIATDLKLCNILLGLMSHSSQYPCCWCDIDKNNIAKFKQEYLKLNISVTLYFTKLWSFAIGRRWVLVHGVSKLVNLYIKFTKCWEKYKFRDTDHPQYGSKLLQAVQTFNGLNM